MIPYLEKNVNPRNRKTTDCVIRALTVATGEDYYKVLNDLYNIQVETGYDMAEKRSIDHYMKRNGWTKHKQPKKPNGKKYLVGEIDLLIDEGDPVVISLAGHLTAVKDDHLVDDWDCRYKTIGNYYTK
jgi:hypothetical protein